MKGQTLIFGIHAVAGFLARSPQNLLGLMVAGDVRNPRVRSLVEEAKIAGARIETTSSHELDRMSGGANHQGVVARVLPVADLGENDLDALITSASGPALLLVLDEVQDPHNLGACLRSADAAGVHAVIRLKRRSAPLNAAARKVASGAAETVPLVSVTNLARTLKRLADAGVTIVGLAGDSSTVLYDVDLTGPVALVLGGEESGLRRLTRESCDDLAQIPMAGTVESLNVSVSAGVALFEAKRQRLG